MDAFSTLLDGRELTLFGVVFWLQKYYTKIPPEGMRLRLRPMCWFLHCIDNSVSSSNIIDGGSQFIGKQWEHHIKTNGSTISKPMGARPWLLSKSYACSFFYPAYGAVKFIDFGFPFLLSLQRCVGIAATNGSETEPMH